MLQVGSTDDQLDDESNEQFLDCVCDQLGKDTTLDDSNDEDYDNAPNDFIYIRGVEENDREKPFMESLWKDFEIPLLDKNG